MIVCHLTLLDHVFYFCKLLSNRYCESNYIIKKCWLIKRHKCFSVIINDYNWYICSLILFLVTFMFIQSIDSTGVQNIQIWAFWWQRSVISCMTTINKICSSGIIKLIFFRRWEQMHKTQSKIPWNLSFSICTDQPTNL